MATQKSDTTTTIPVINGVVVVFLFDFLPQHRIWAWMKLMQGTRGLFKTFPGLRFAKVMGSGEGGGFGLRPSSTHQGLIMVFDDLIHAYQSLKSGEIMRYQEKTHEYWQGVLLVDSCRGSWDHQSWNSQNVLQEAVQDPVQSGSAHDGSSAYIASLTRASIRASQAMNFWRFAPPAQVDLKKASGCELAVGLGEAPLLRQCTFSVWQDAQSLTNYAHQGAHMRAIGAAQKHNFFTESMFVRMKVLHMWGQWMGKTFDTDFNEITPLALN